MYNNTHNILLLLYKTLFSIVSMWLTAPKTMSKYVQSNEVSCENAKSLALQL